jgi:hypothetical protein
LRASGFAGVGVATERGDPRKLTILLLIFVF